MNRRRALCFLAMGLVACVAAPTWAQQECNHFVVQPVGSLTETARADLASRQQHTEIENYVYILDWWEIYDVILKTWECWTFAAAGAYDLGGVTVATDGWNGPGCPSHARAPKGGGWLLSPLGHHDAFADAWANKTADCAATLISTVGVSWRVPPRWGGAWGIQAATTIDRFTVIATLLVKRLLIIIYIPWIPADVPLSEDEVIVKEIYVWSPQLGDIFWGRVIVDRDGNLIPEGDIDPAWIAEDPANERWVIESPELYYEWPAPGDYYFEVYEEINDYMTVGCCQCPGDLAIPCDGYVNVTDFTVFASAYNSSVGTPNYNRCADLNDDDYVNITDFTAFASYYLQPCPPPGDNCEKPITVALPANLPYSDANTTCGRGNYYQDTCLAPFDYGEDIIYELIVEEPMTVEILLYPKGTPNTGIALDDSCPPDYDCIAMSTRAEPVPHGIDCIDLMPGTYYIMIDSWEDPGCIPEFALTITNCDPCDVLCPSGGIPEGEPICHDGYIDEYNGGCNSDPPVFSPIECGNTVCGTSGTFVDDLGAPTRDTDWYEITTDTFMTFYWTAKAEFPLQICIIDGTEGCEYMQTIECGYFGECQLGEVAAFCMPPGTYWFFVAPDAFSGIPCGAEYVATLTCEECPVKSEGGNDAAGVAARITDAWTGITPAP